MLQEKLAGLLAGFLFSIYSSTFRYKLIFENETDRKPFFDALSFKDPIPGKNLVLACFHQDDLACLPYFSHHNICILVSQSKDGEILAAATEFMGYQTVRGSSHRGAVAGLLAAMKKVFQGHHLTIAVDGPRGPIFKVKDGITAIAQKAGLSIVPVRAHVSWKYVFKKSWNKAILPMPFSEITLHMGMVKSYSTQELEDKLTTL